MPKEFVLQLRHFASDAEYLEWVYSRCTRLQMVGEIYHLTIHMWGFKTVSCAPGFEDARLARLIALERLFGMIKFNDDLPREAAQRAVSQS